MTDGSGGHSMTGALGSSASALVHSYLDRHGKPAERLADGVIAAPLAGSSFDASWQLWLAAAGPERTWLVAQIRAAHRVPRERWPQAIEACNAWNSSSPLSKAWLAVDGWDTATDGGLVLEATMPLDGGVEQDVVDGFLDGLRRDAVEFWRALLRV